MIKKEAFMRVLAPIRILNCNHHRRTAMLTKTSRMILSLIFTSTMFSSSASALEAYPSADLGETTILRYHVSGWVNIGALQYSTLSWNCPGRHPTGGGFETRPVPNDFANVRVFKSYPSNNGQWRIRLRNEENIARDVRIWVVCAE